MSVIKEKLVENFVKVFKEGESIDMFFSPGRVNLIGEHTDYNGGHVFPCALTMGTYAAVRKRNDQIIKMYSENFPEKGIIEFSMQDLKYVKDHDWANYPKGVLFVFENNGNIINCGFEVLYYGNIPNGAGLSSSASIELATAVMINHLYDFNMDRVEMVKMCQKSENEFMGVNCGIMDQFAIGMGKRDCALLLNTSNLNYKYANLPLEHASLVISNTNKRRGLADSKYNERRDQCEKAIKDLQQKLDIYFLGELTEEEFEKYKHLIKDDVHRKRAKHAVYENQRTLRAAKALEAGNIEEFGRLMNESHISLREDYEVTGIELDTLVELSWNQEGVIGSRMTGAGFGGCTISIVENDKIEGFMEKVGQKYKEKIGYEPSFYVAGIGDGTTKLV